MIECFADLHIHIGATESGRPVKIAASKRLTLSRILNEAAMRKGLHMIGIVDCASPEVLLELERLLDRGELSPLAGGGARHKERLTLIYGVELGIDVLGKEAHFLSYFPTLAAVKEFAERLRPHVTNLSLSSQKARITLSSLLAWTEEQRGFLVPAHAFTPHKGYYGRCGASLLLALSPAEMARVPAIELGLSADTEMASCLSELDGKAFLSNSDAHSLAKIGREYNRLRLPGCDFDSLIGALRGTRGEVLANYGLEPRLGKYHRTYCHECARIVPLTPARVCPSCGGGKITVGVADRLQEVADRPPRPGGRPPYVYQVPLEMIPGVGRQSVRRLLEAFGTEMEVLHRADADQLRQVVPEPVVARILRARTGQLRLQEGAGGTYGRVQVDR